MTGALVAALLQDPVSEENGVFRSPTAGGSWPITKKERISISRPETNLPHPSTLKTRATMPIFGRSQTQTSFSSILDFVKLAKTPDSAINGDTMSQLRQIFRQAIHEYSPLSPVAAMIMNVQSRTVSSGVSVALSYALPREAKMADFVPQVEVKSKKRRGAWKTFYATIDTGCHSGDWVSLQVIDKLGYSGKLLPLTDAERRGSLNAGGMELNARGAVNLTWHAIPGEGLPSCTKTFKRRFLVAAVLDPPFEMLIGLKSICADRILFAPTLTVPRRRILGLPRPQPSQTPIPLSETYEELRKKNDEEFAAAELEEERKKQAAKERNNSKPSRAPKHPDTPMGSRSSSLISMQSENSGRELTVTNTNKTASTALRKTTDDNVKMKAKTKPLKITNI